MSDVTKCWNDAKFGILSRTKDNVTEYYIGDVDYITDFHNPNAWNVSYDECRPSPMHNDLQQSFDLLRLVYNDYSFGFHYLILSKKLDSEDNAKLDHDHTHMVDSTGANADRFLSDKQSD